MDTIIVEMTTGPIYHRIRGQQRTTYRAYSLAGCVSVCSVAVRTIVLSRHGCFHTTLWIFCVLLAGICAIDSF